MRRTSSGVTTVTRGETPGTFEEHAHAEAEVLTARNVLHLLLAREDRFVAIAIDADVRVADTEFARGAQRDVSERILVEPFAAASSAAVTLLIQEGREASEIAPEQPRPSSESHDERSS